MIKPELNAGNRRDEKDKKTGGGGKKIEFARAATLVRRFFMSFRQATNCSWPDRFCFNFNYLSLRGPHCMISGREFDTRDATRSFRSALSIRFIATLTMRGHRVPHSLSLLSSFIIFPATLFEPKIEKVVAREGRKRTCVRCKSRYNSTLGLDVCWRFRNRVTAVL